MRISDWSSDVCSSDLARRGRPQGKCHRKQTALRSARGLRPGALRKLRVKGCGKSAPRARQRGRHGKPHSEQDQVGTAGRSFGTEATRVFAPPRSEAHTSELQSLMRISYAVFCLKQIQATQHNL